MSLRKEFQGFLLRGNVVDLAVAVVIGAAFTKIVGAFVSDLLMPLLSVFLPAGGWRLWSWTPVEGMELKIGNFVGASIDFVIIALVVFLLLVKLLGRFKTAPIPVPTKNCPECAETVMAQAKRCKFCTSALVALAVVFLLAGPAQAQDPKFVYVKPEAPAGAPEWKAQVKGGLLQTSGNARSTSGIIGAVGSYKKDADRITLEGGATYVHSSSRQFFTGVDDQGRERVGSNSVGRTTSNQWLAKGRYDRFVTQNNSIYGSAQMLADKPAGKEIVAGGQAGYSRQLIKNEMHLVVAEIGYDLSYERSTAAGAEGVGVHSGRLFASETLTVTKDTGLTAGIEVLSNLNHEKESKPGYQAIYGDLGTLKDTRVNGKLSLTTTLWSNVSFGFGFTARYDNRPGLLAVPSGLSPTAYPPRARKLDTIIEANLIVTLF